MQSARWSHAESLEYEQKDYSAAAEMYAEVAEQASEAATSVPALRARIRCLVKTGKRTEAIGEIREFIRHPEYGGIRDRHARLVVPDLQLHLLTLLRSKRKKDLRIYHFGEFELDIRSRKLSRKFRIILMKYAIPSIRPPWNDHLKERHQPCLPLKHAIFF